MKLKIKNRIALLSLSLAAHTSQACTSISTTVPDGTMVVGRSMEMNGSKGALSHILELNGLNLTQKQFDKPTSIIDNDSDSLIPWLISIHPSDQKHGGCVLCEDSSTWNSKYSFVSVDVRIDLESDDEVLRGFMDKFNATSDRSGMNNVFEFSTDGMNEAGLTVSSLLFHKSTYQTPPPVNTLPNLTATPTSLLRKSISKSDVTANIPVSSSRSSTKVCWLDMSHWILGNFENVADLKDILLDQEAIYTIGAVNPMLSFFNLHWRVDDPEGKSIVIEYVDGKLSIHNNSVGVVTNDPPFDWHLQNLGNYINLRPTSSIDPKTDTNFVQIDSDIGLVPSQPGTGSNTIGMPGDYTSASRFVKMFYLTQMAIFNEPIKTVEDAIQLVSGLLDSVFIPKGVIALKDGDPKNDILGHELTQYTVMKVPQKKAFYYKDYYNSQWRKLDLSTMDLTKPAYRLLADGTLNIKDETEAFFDN